MDIPRTGITIMTTDTRLVTTIIFATSEGDTVDEKNTGRMKEVL
jgi:hypothetical protein